MKWEKLRQKYDRENVLPWLRKFPDQCIEAIYVGNKFRAKKRKIERIVGCGMGGSGVGLQILRNLLKEELRVPFEVFHSYELPAYVDSKTLVLCVSFSGNTEETLACYRQAKKKMAYVIAFATGGTLGKMAKGNCVMLPKGSPVPRMAVAYLCLPALIVLQKLGLIESKASELNEMVFLLKKGRDKIEEKGKELALKLRGKLPVIYASEELQTVTYRFRTELNENSKQFALNNFLPEHNHNEINGVFGLERGNCHFIFLRHGKEPEKIVRRFRYIAKVFKRKFNITEVQLEGRNLIAIVFYALQLAAMTSYYLALLNHIDPEITPPLKELKQVLKRK